jgi:hypothetical protein
MPIRVTANLTMEDNAFSLDGELMVVPTSKFVILSFTRDGTLISLPLTYDNARKLGFRLLHANLKSEAVPSELVIGG